jgi:hypothetical protein
MKITIVKLYACIFGYAVDIEAACFSETWADIYQTTGHDIQEDINV